MCVVYTERIMAGSKRNYIWTWGPKACFNSRPGVPWFSYHNFSLNKLVRLAFEPRHTPETHSPWSHWSLKFTSLHCFLTKWETKFATMPRSAQCDRYRSQRSRNLHKTNLHKLQPQLPVKNQWLPWSLELGPSHGQYNQNATSWRHDYSACLWHKLTSLPDLSIRTTIITQTQMCFKRLQRPHSWLTEKLGF